MTYPGGKNGAGVYQQIINIMPPHAVYFEPFLGSGAVMRMKRPARLNIGSDVKLLTTTVSAVLEGHRHAWREDPQAEIRPAYTAKNWDTPRHHGYLFTQQGAASLIEDMRPKNDWLVYCDPPYLFQSRRQLARDRYENEMTDRDHIRLLRLLKRLPAAVIISGYQNELYTRMLEDWSTKSFQTTVRGGGTATEVLWFNFPEPTELHDYRYLGTDYRERERIKKKTKRWTQKLGAMPKLERQALLCALETYRTSHRARPPVPRPSTEPASTSLSQCNRRITREAATATASSSSGGSKTRARPPTETATAKDVAEWPEGKEN